MQAAEEIRRACKPAPSGFVRSNTSVILKWPEDRASLFIFAHRIQLQTLGLSVWDDKKSEWMAVVAKGLKVLQVETLNRIGFKVSVHIPLDMSHAEMSRLMFGSFLAPIEEFQQLIEEPDDPMVQLDGKCGTLECQLVVTSANRKQLSDGVLRLPNLETFLADRFLDTGVRDFHDRVAASDALVFDIDLFRRDVGVADLLSFPAECLKAADIVGQACLDRLLSRSPQKVK